MVTGANTAVIILQYPQLLIVMLYTWNEYGAVVSSLSLLVLSVVLSVIEEIILKSMTIIMSLSTCPCIAFSSLLHVLWSSVVQYISLLDSYVLLLNWPLYPYKISFFKKNFIGVWLIYSIVLLSGVQQGESAIHIHVSTLFQILFPYRSLQSIE